PGRNDRRPLPWSQEYRPPGKTTVREDATAGGAPAPEPRRGGRRELRAQALGHRRPPPSRRSPEGAADPEAAASAAPSGPRREYSGPGFRGLAPWAVLGRPSGAPPPGGASPRRGI